MATMPTTAIQLGSGTIRKKIGSTTYTVSIHFSQTCKENIEDKIIRLLKNDAEMMKEAAGE